VIDLRAATGRFDRVDREMGRKSRKGDGCRQSKLASSAMRQDRQYWSRHIRACTDRKCKENVERTRICSDRRQYEPCHNREGVDVGVSLAMERGYIRKDRKQKHSRRETAGRAVQRPDSRLAKVLSCNGRTRKVIGAEDGLRNRRRQ